MTFPGSGTFNLGGPVTASPGALVSSLAVARGLKVTLRRIPMWQARLRLLLEKATRRCWLGPDEICLLREGLTFDTQAAEESLGWRPRFGDVVMVSRAFDAFLRQAGRMS